MSELRESILTNAGALDPERFANAKATFDSAEWLVMTADITVTNKFPDGPQFGIILIMSDALGKKFKLSITETDMKRLTESWASGKAKSDFFLGKGAQV